MKAIVERRVCIAVTRVRVRRFHNRGRYDPETIAAILDAGIFCHVAFEYEGAPAVIPMLYWRDETRLYVHGSTASRMMKAIVERRVCIAVTVLDGLVLARSAFHHSANYRSVVIYAKPSIVEPASAKTHQLQRMMERFFPGRWPELRPVHPQELKATMAGVRPGEPRLLLISHAHPDHVSGLPEFF